MEINTYIVMNVFHRLEEFVKIGPAEVGDRFQIREHRFIAKSLVMLFANIQQDGP